MYDGFAAAAAAFGFAVPEDFAWIIVGAVLAGLVRGFTGFGTAMVFLPIAGAVLPPVWAVTIFVIMDIIAPLPLAPKVARDSDFPDLLRLTVGALVGVPVGVAILKVLPSEVFRFSVSALAILLLILLVFGLRFHGILTRPMVFGAGGLGGFFAGAVGMPGPPVIALYLASPLPAAAARANIYLYLVITNVLILAVFALQDILYRDPVVLGFVIAVPYLAGIIAGTLAFDPKREKTYRTVAFAVIFCSAVGGLPLFG